MKSTHLIPLATLGAVCGLSLLGMASKVWANEVVDVELAFLLDASGSDFASDLLFDNIKAAHVDLFQSRNFFKTYVAPLPNQKIAVSFWIYARGVANPVDWSLIDSQAAAFDFGKAIENKVSKSLLTNRINLGEAIQRATVSINGNAFDGDYRILDLASNGAEFPAVGTSAALDAATSVLSLPGNQKISAINSISTTQVLDSVLPDIIGLSTNNDNPVEQHGFSLTDLNFDRDPNNPKTPTSYLTALRQKVSRETVGTRPVATPEPSALWALFGLGLVSLTSKLTKNKLIK